MTVATLSPPLINFENLAWVHDNPSTIAYRPKASSSRVLVHTRRPHKKSRQGCGNCKRRRVKCDESSPKCSRCIQQRIVCHYSKQDLQSKPASESSAESPWSSALTTSMASDLTVSHLRGVLYTRKEFRYCDPASGTQDGIWEILQHFMSIGCDTTGTPAVQQNMRTVMITLSKDSPFLLNATFAFSAKHLHALNPFNRNYQIAAAHYGQVALELYSQELNSKITLENVDSLIAACLLVSACAFSTVEMRPSDSFIFSEKPEAADWLNIVTGLPLLIHREETWPVVSQSIWKSVFSTVNLLAFQELQPGIDGIPTVFVELCGLKTDSTVISNPYLSSLRLLINIIGIEATRENFSKLMQFPCRMTPEFNQLLQEKDPAALLILGYWFAKLCNIDFWWCSERARTECLAVCTYLDGFPDNRIQVLLQWPVEVCGYIRIDLDLIETLVFGM